MSSLRSLIETIINELASREDWDDFTEATPDLPKTARAFRVTAVNESGTRRLTLLKVNGTPKDIAPINLNDFEPVKFIGVASMGAGIASYRVYY